MKLYEYPGRLDKLVRMATEDGDLSDEMLAELQHLGDDFKEKVVNCVKIIKELESSVDAIKGEIDRLRSKQHSFKGKLGWLKAYVHDQMVGMEMDVVKDDLFTVRVQETPGRVEIVDQTMIPPRYLEHGEVKVLKSAILTSMKEGELVPGCELVKSTSLRIR
jgi:hypothetical protein